LATIALTDVREVTDQVRATASEWQVKTTEVERDIGDVGTENVQFD
jgi:hypothetical protein